MLDIGFETSITFQLNFHNYYTRLYIESIYHFIYVTYDGANKIFDKFAPFRLIRGHFRMVFQFDNLKWIVTYAKINS